jgi:hypothetical protein
LARRSASKPAGRKLPSPSAQSTAQRATAAALQKNQTAPNRFVRLDADPAHALDGCYAAVHGSLEGARGGAGADVDAPRRVHQHGGSPLSAPPLSVPVRHAPPAPRLQRSQATFFQQYQRGGGEADAPGRGHQHGGSPLSVRLAPPPLSAPVRHASFSPRLLRSQATFFQQYQRRRLLADPSEPSDELLRSMRRFVRAAVSAAELPPLRGSLLASSLPPPPLDTAAPAATTPPPPPPPPPLRRETPASLGGTPASGWKLPSLVLVGAVGCESEALAAVLATHPRVFLPQEEGGTRECLLDADGGAVEGVAASTRALERYHQLYQQVVHLAFPRLVE